MRYFDWQVGRDSPKHHLPPLSSTNCERENKLVYTNGEIIMFSSGKLVNFLPRSAKKNGNSTQDWHGSYYLQKRRGEERKFAPERRTLLFSTTPHANRQIRTGKKILTCVAPFHVGGAAYQKLNLGKIRRSTIRRCQFEGRGGGTDVCPN